MTLTIAAWLAVWGVIPALVAILALIERASEYAHTDQLIAQRMDIPLPVDRWPTPVSPSDAPRDGTTRTLASRVDSAARWRCVADPCTARHCAAHARIVGTVAQRRPSRTAEQLAAHIAWTTPTAEWAVMLVGAPPVPNSPETLMETT